LHRFADALERTSKRALALFKELLEAVGAPYGLTKLAEYFEALAEELRGLRVPKLELRDFVSVRRERLVSSGLTPRPELLLSQSSVYDAMREYLVHYGLPVKGVFEAKAELLKERSRAVPDVIEKISKTAQSVAFRLV
jgi:hypothetical protein